MADRFGSDVVERALAMQEGSVLANEVLRLRRIVEELTPGVGPGAVWAELERLWGMERRAREIVAAGIEWSPEFRRAARRILGEA